MKTIKEITDMLHLETEWQPWMEELINDDRIGVQKRLKQWVKQYQSRENLIKEHIAKTRFDQSFDQKDAFIAGVDEAGRGPLAGPVVTSAVILPKDTTILIGLNDSKQLSKEKRMQFALDIKKIAISYSIHFQPSSVIDEVNIYEATKQSMIESVRSLTVTPHFVIVDAMNLPIEIPTASIIKGDEKSLAIAAASILAKTARDEYMEKLDEKYPHYAFAKNAGYGTKEHLKGLEQYGPTPEHRRSFEPIKSLISSKSSLPVL